MPDFGCDHCGHSRELHLKKHRFGRGCMVCGCIDRPCVTIAWKWGKWTFGFWIDLKNKTYFGIDSGPLEVAWRAAGYRP